MEHKTRKAVRTPSQNRSAITREAILNHALKLFAAKGYEGTSIRDIAAAMGVNHGLIKYYFGSKEELWKEAVSFLFIRLRTETSVRDEEVDLPLKQRFETFVRRYVRYCARYPEHARLMVQESMSDNPRIAWAAKTEIALGHSRVLPLFEGLMEEGWLPRISPVMFLYAINAAAQAPFSLAPELAHTHGIDVMEESAIDTYADALLKLFLREKSPTG